VIIFPITIVDITYHIRCDGGSNVSFNATDGCHNQLCVESYGNAALNVAGVVGELSTVNMSVMQV